MGNIAFEATEEELRGVFEKCRATKIRLHHDKDTGKFRGFAHVHFESEEGLDQAIKLHGYKLHSRRLTIGYAQKKKED